MINQIYNEEMRTSKKLKIKFQKKAGMKDSQLIMQHLAESVARESQKLEPTPNPFLHESKLQEHLSERRRQSSVHQNDWFMNDHPLAQSNYFTPADRITFGSIDNRDRSYDRFQSNCSLKSSLTSSQLFSIPNKVTELIGHYPEYLKILSDDIQNQKRKICVDCNRLKDLISEEIDKKQNELLNTLDQILINYESNYQTLQDMVNQFKQSFLQVPSALNRSIPVNISSITIFHYDQDENYKKIKEEKCLIKQRLSNIDSELMKRTLIFMAEDMDNQITHKPGYRHTETLQLKYDEFQKQLINSITTQLNEMNLVMELTPQYNYEHILLLPKVETVIANNRQNAIGGDRDLQELENLKTLIQNKLKSQKFNMNISLGLGQSMKNFGLKLEYKYQSNNPLLSIQAITDNIIAVGSRNGLVQVWDLKNKEQCFTIQTKQSVTCMRVFKGFQGDFNVTSRANALGVDLKEQQYLITGNQDIKIWDIKTGGMIKQLKGQGNVITSMLCLLDNHTLISGHEDGKVSFWNAYSGMVMKKLQDHSDSVNGIILTKDGRVITGGSDKNIIIYQIHYVRSQIYTRQVFGDALKQQVLRDECQIYCMQASMIDENLFVTGGSDCKIKIWNLKSQKIEKEIMGHKQPVGDFVMLENPLDVDKEKMFAIVSVATSEDVLRISTSISPLNSGVYLNEKIVNEFGATCGPLLQLIQDKEGLRLLVVNQDEENQSFMILKLQ
ncbi:unnamed protein product [Paramecium pentaurelia]|uniref:Uncharacterized protein n=1 Tax=Paramecium pentaurelia TaxID=43138 RepID=A0A8S1YG52_9CILI|nr:unnamed protein product [Paramecium pentaurelia]